jgi:hypothetical protein
VSRTHPRSSASDPWSSELRFSKSSCGVVMLPPSDCCRVSCRPISHASDCDSAPVSMLGLSGARISGWPISAGRALWRNAVLPCVTSPVAVSVVYGVSAATIATSAEFEYATA